MPAPSHDPVALLRERFLNAMHAALGEALPTSADPLISPSRQPELGDFQANAAMPLAKVVGRPPREVAAKIVAHLDLGDIAHPVTEDDIAGPGFINVRLREDTLASLLAALDDDRLGVGFPERRETVVVDLCGVNLAKQMHVGHLRATCIGDAVARVFERLGHTVLRQNHLGDWGLPIAMVTAALKRKEQAGAITLDDLTLDDLDSAYRAAQRECDADRKGLAAVDRFDLGPKARAELEAQVSGAEARLAEARAALVELQRGEPETLRVWEKISRITIDECVRICQRLGANVTPEHTAGESTYRAELPEIVEDLRSRGVAVPSEGALVVELAEVGIKEPLLVQKSDGGFLYATTDLAGVRRRVRDLGADRAIYCVDARQSLHFRQVFAACRKAGYDRKPDGKRARLTHAAFGTVLGPDNRPFKTRSGDNVKLTDLLDEAEQRAGAAVAQRNTELAPDERAPIAHAVAIAAIKYVDLSSDRIRDYVFDFDRMLAFEGDTGPYLLYALVRIRSIFRKAERDFDDPALDRAAVSVGAPEEKRLALALLRYPATLQSVADSCEPHRLCGYLFELAGAFSSFFKACPVIQAPDEATREGRLRLCRLTGRILEDGLHNLGIPTLERM